jgi:hypothetical protein
VQRRLFSGGGIEVFPDEFGDAPTRTRLEVRDGGVFCVMVHRTAFVDSSRDLSRSGFIEKFDSFRQGKSTRGNVNIIRTSLSLLVAALSYSA